MTKQKYIDILSSEIAYSLNGKLIHATENNLYEFMTAYRQLYGKLHKSLRRFLKSWNDYEERRKSEGWKNGSQTDVTIHLDDLLDVVYVIAELSEFYTKGTGKLFALDTRKYRKLKDIVEKPLKNADIICNDSKHSSTFLQPIEVIYLNGNIVTGFCVYQIFEGKCTILDTINPRKNAFSFNLFLKNTLAQLMLVEYDVAEYIENMPIAMGGHLVNLDSFNLPHFKELKEISNLPLYGMPNENVEKNIVLKDGNIELQNYKSKRFPMGEGLMRCYFDFFGHDIKIEIPYVNGTKCHPFPKTKDNKMLAPYIRANVYPIKVIDRG